MKMRKENIDHSMKQLEVGQQAEAILQTKAKHKFSFLNLI